MLRFRIHLILSDLEHLPFRKDSFHIVVSITSLQNLSSIFEGIRQIMRVVKNEGDVKMTILRKNLDIKKLISFSNSLIKNIDIIDNEQMEDIIIQGKAKK